MTQGTQILMTKGSASMHVQSDDVATYLAAGYRVEGIRYSEAGDAVDSVSLFLMKKGSDSIYVLANDVQTYISNGYQLTEILYGADRVQVTKESGPLAYLDIPAYLSAEVGSVADTTVVVTFSTEVEASNYATGVTIKVDDVSKTISAAERQTDHTVVHYTIPAVAFGEVVTFSYSSATGAIHSENDDTYMDSVTDGEVTNNVAEA